MPARKPRGLKLITGTIQPCRDREELDLPRVDGLPEPPTFLDVTGATEFDRVARILHGAGVLTEADLGLLSAYAAAWSDLVRKWENRLQPPAADLTAFRQLATELGLSPKARASMPGGRKGGKPNRFADLGKPRQGDSQ